MNIPIRNSIISTNGINAVLGYFKKNINHQNLRIIGEADKMFVIDKSRAVIVEAMKSSEKTKYIILLGNSFKLEAQNALLRVLEDTPRNVIILIIANNSQSVIPTIRSRLHKLSWKINNTARTPKDIIDYRNMTDRKLVETLLNNKRISRDKIAEMIRDVIVIDGIAHRASFTFEELNKLTDYLELLRLNSPAQAILSVFLSILNSSYKRRA